MKYVVGDIHGAGEELQALLEKVGFKIGQDELLPVGDLFDRARNAYQVWDILKRYNAKSTHGNHERKFQKSFRHGRLDSLPPHYIWALNHLYERGTNLDEFAAYINAQPLIITPAEGVIVTHGGVNIDDPYKEEEGANVYGHLVPEAPMPRPTKGDKETYWWDHYKGDPLVIYGHLVCEKNKPRINYSAQGKINSVGIDTAVCHGGPITAYCIETGETTQYSSGVDHFDILKKEFKKNYPVPRKEVLDWLKVYYEKNGIHNVQHGIKRR